MRHDEYVQYDGLGLAELVTRGDITATEAMQAALDRTDAVNPALNAVVERWDDDALADAESSPTGPLHGVPALAKDMDGMLAGRLTTYSSRSLRDYVPEQDSELFVRLRRAGLTFFGKTGTPEMGILGISESEFRGPSRNPWALDHTPGGSSGGSAAAVAAGIVPIAHGGDGGGSLRIPASHCGLFGIKTSRGLTPLGPYDGEAWDGLVTRLVMSRSVRDSAAALDAVRGEDVGPPYAAPRGPRSYLAASGKKPKRLRIGFSTRSLFGQSMHPECVAAVEQAAWLLEDLGHEVFELDLPVIPQEGAKAYLTIVASNVAALVEWTQNLTGRKPDPRNFERTTWFINQVGRELSGAELTQARIYGQLMGRQLGHLFAEDVDVHLTATVAVPPVRIGELDPTAAEKAALSVLQRVSHGAVLRRVFEDLAANSLEATPNTQLYNMTGQPAASVPMHITSTGLPVGVQIAAGFGKDALLFQLATQIEQAKPWVQNLPLTKDL